VWRVVVLALEAVQQHVGVLHVSHAVACEEALDFLHYSFRLAVALGIVRARVNGFHACLAAGGFPRVLVHCSAVGEY